MIESSNVASHPRSINTMLIIPKTIPNLAITEMFSLKNIIPIKETITRFNIVKIEIAFDNISYFNENAQNKAPIEYIMNPPHIKRGLCSTVHFLKNTSPTISRLTPSKVNNQNNIFVDIIFYFIKLKISYIITTEFPEIHNPPHPPLHTHEHQNVNADQGAPSIQCCLSNQ